MAQEPIIPVPTIEVGITRLIQGLWFTSSQDQDQQDQEEGR